LEVNTPLRGLTADHCLAGNFTLPIDFQRPGAQKQQKCQAAKKQ